MFQNLDRMAGAPPASASCVLGSDEQGVNLYQLRRVLDFVKYEFDQDGSSGTPPAYVSWVLKFNEYPFIL